MQNCRCNCKLTARFQSARLIRVSSEARKSGNLLCHRAEQSREVPPWLKGQVACHYRHNILQDALDHQCDFPPRGRKGHPKARLQLIGLDMEQIMTFLEPRKCMK